MNAKSIIRHALARIAATPRQSDTITRFVNVESLCQLGEHVQVTFAYGKVNVNRFGEYSAI